MGLLKRQGRPAGKATSKRKTGGGGGKGHNRSPSASRKHKGRLPKPDSTHEKRRPQDIYEYIEGQSSTGKRRHAREDEDDGNEQYNFVARKDDEEIDEDGAFDSEDEKRYGDLMRQIKANNEVPRRGNPGRGKGKKEEDEEEEMDEDPEEGGVMLSDLLGGKKTEEKLGKLKGKDDALVGRKKKIERVKEEAKKEEE